MKMARTTDEHDRTILRLAEIRQQQADLRAEADQIRDTILGWLEVADADGLENDLGKRMCHKEIHERRKTNLAKLEAMHPEVYADVIETRTSTVLKIDAE